ncbi:ATP-binding cassette domain-containing protein [Streptomyces sp. SID4919]|uniref:ATP-binding cassette domain-containing protein n=1 Tax=unclassified Streptomyces TaxID=2593676 RepID=UPI0008239768|nr:MULTISPECIES: ATP-binding cassette domain-containing protein [unclassified Streptomyces]MYY12184.1 ATP-binding cassette domain-containing protein [Streptomyces sp. SID4919]SCK44863.1 ABC-2 type transport system ATP-binding protein [Streptomyces sp. AmelKG-E11A]
MTSIDVRELTKEYGKTRAVDGLTFSVGPGRVTGFLGPNGAGKSTTLRLVLGLDRPTTGTATVGGRHYTAIGEPLRHVGALLDPQSVHGGRTARQHLLALAVGNRLPARRVEEVLEETGLGPVGRRRVRTFSLGMRQRLGIAAALLGDPAVVILDEPSNGLDPEGIVWIRDTLRRLAREGRTVLVSSHLMNETATFADQLVVLGRGRLLADLPMRDFIAAHGTSRTRVRTPDAPRLDALLTSAGHRLAPAGDGMWAVAGLTAAEVGAIAAGEGIPLLELVTEEATLEQAYLALTATSAEFAASTTAQEV